MTVFQFSLSFFAPRFFLIAAQLYVARSIVRHPTPVSRLAVYSAAATFGHWLFYPLPAFGQKIIMGAITHLTLLKWIFQTPLFPDAVFIVAIPLVLAFGSQRLLIPIFAYFFGSEGALWLLFLPSFILAVYFLNTKKVPRGEQTTPALPAVYKLGAAVFFLHTRSIFLLIRQRIPLSLLDEISLYTCIVLVSAVILSSLRQMRKTEHNSKVIQHHALKNHKQSSALQTLREERHDILNELALVSIYLQTQQWDKAHHCLSYVIATLSDHYNCLTLPEDAWLAALELKRRKALHLNIDFTADIEAEPPRGLTEQRLLPKLIVNLVDNAFAAVENTEEPQVRLSWGLGEDNKRILTVANNGPAISPLEGRRIFQPNMTSKHNHSGNHGWGLVICRKIADELRGSLTYESNCCWTTFILTLPPASSQNSGLQIYKRGTTSPSPLRIMSAGTNPRTEVRG